MELASHLRSLSTWKVKSTAGRLSIPRVCCGALQGGVCVFQYACLSRAKSVRSGPQWHHPQIQHDRADKTQCLPAGTARGLWKGSGCFLLMCVCKPCRNKATFSSTAVVQTSSLNKPQKAWVLWKFWQSNAFLQSFTTQMEGVQFYWRRMKPGVLLRNIKHPM